MSTIRGSLTHTDVHNVDIGISDRSLNYSFLKEFLNEGPEWVEFVSIQLGYETTQPVDKLEAEIERIIKTAKNSNKFGL